MIFREVSARIFPWDYVDEGADHLVDTLQETTLCNSIHTAVMLHHEKRPHGEMYYPHNPRRKVYWTEDSRAYWHADPAFYRDSRITPAPTENSELAGTDWAQFAVDLCRRRGLLAGAHLSHTWVDKPRVAAEFPDTRQQDIYGKPSPSFLCPNSPDLRAYARAIFTEIATRYDFDFIQCSFSGFIGAPNSRQKMPEIERLIQLTLGACFCPHCRRTAEAAGLHWEAIVDRLRWIADGHDAYNARQAFELRLLRNSSITVTQLLTEIPEFFVWLKFRADSYTTFWRILHTASHAGKPTIDLRFNCNWMYPEFYGFDLKAMSPYFDSIRGADYLEEQGTQEAMETKRGFYNSIRRTVGLDKHFVTAVSQRLRCTAELVKQTIQLTADCGADGTTIASYDTATLALLRAMRDGYAAAEVTVEPAPPRAS